MKIIRLLHGFFGLVLLAYSSISFADTSIVRITTNIGDIDVLLYADKAPDTVANFLAYVDSGQYNDTLFHRVIDGFMIQGGGFTQDFEKKKTGSPVKNEAYNGQKNEIGTLAMARTGNPHSATAQFFINVNNNSFLDFKIAPYGPLNTLRQSQLGIQDGRTQRIATNNCRGQRITRNTLEKAASAKPGGSNHYDCLMRGVLHDPAYSTDRELSVCLSQIKQLKQEGKLGADATCSDYIDNRHQALKLVHVSWGYAVFGKVIQGMAIVDKIKSSKTGPGGPFRKDVPEEAIVIKSIKRIPQEQSQ